MTFNEYQQDVNRTINHNNSNLDCQFHALYGMVSEIGEIHALYQKEYQGHEMNPMHLMSEVGDLLWFIGEFCTSQGWTMDEVAQLNVDKRATRYPNGFDAQRSLYRSENDV